MTNEKKRIAIIGSTGSIGTQALDVITRNPERFEVVALAANRNIGALVKQVARFNPKVAVLVEPTPDFPDGVDELADTEWSFGTNARDRICAMPEVDEVLICVVGMAGLSAVMECIKHKKRVLLANKEALMTGGDMVMRAARENGVEIMPVDSEHTSLHQCLLGREPEEIDRLVLTASGGPFRTWEKAAMLKATADDALKHPNWSMGRKITVDSATMMNKAIEVVEAHHLFNMPPEKIEVAVHPQSIVHSAVYFRDGSMTASMNNPDMRIPILYAMTGTSALDTGAKPFSLFDMPKLTFERCDTDKFPFVKMAYDLLAAGGTGCVIANAANEEAVVAFLEGRIFLGDIIDIVNRCLDELFNPKAPTMCNVFSYDLQARLLARDLLADIKRA